MAEVTLVCCYNDKKIYASFLDALNKQNTDLNILGINNCDNKYTSCASAYNDNLDNVKTKYVIFSHQDIVLLNDETIKEVLNNLKRIDENDILGIAGVTKEGRLASNIVQGDSDERYSSLEVRDLIKVDTVDECFFGGHLNCFKNYRFNEELCDSWHLCAVERCLACNLRNDNVYVSGIAMKHLSFGRLNSSFYKTLDKICNYYGDRLDYFYTTTCLKVYTKSPKKELCFLKNKVANLPVVHYFVKLRADILKRQGKI